MGPICRQLLRDTPRPGSAAAGERHSRAPRGRCRRRSPGQGGGPGSPAGVPRPAVLGRAGTAPDRPRHRIGAGHRSAAGCREGRAAGRERVRYLAREHISRRCVRSAGSLDDSQAGCVTGMQSGRLTVAGTPGSEGIINPPIDELLKEVDSKYGLVIMASKRARQINAYYAQLGEGLLEYVGPLVETRVQEKPLSIALREISEGMLSAEATEIPTT